MFCNCFSLLKVKKDNTELNLEVDPCLRVVNSTHLFIRNLSRKNRLKITIFFEHFPKNIKDEKVSLLLTVIKTDWDKDFLMKNSFFRFDKKTSIPITETNNNTSFWSLKVSFIIVLPIWKPSTTSILIQVIFIMA